MNLHILKPAPGSTKSKKRVGRGNSSGHGTTATRGTKGQLARSGGGKGPAFQGGQIPIQRQLPHLPGFKNFFKKEYQVVGIDRLNDLKGEVNPKSLYEARIIRKKDIDVKILANGKIEKAVTVKAHKFSKKAQEAIIAAGGKVEIIENKKKVLVKGVKKAKTASRRSKVANKLPAGRHGQQPTTNN